MASLGVPSPGASSMTAECGALIGSVRVMPGPLVGVHCTKPKGHDFDDVELIADGMPIAAHRVQSEDPHEFRNNGLVIRREVDDV